MKKNRLLKNPGSFVQVLLIPALLALAGLLFLWAATWIPGRWLRENVKESALQLADEGVYAQVTLPGAAAAYVQDNVTEELILETSYTMERPLDILLKPVRESGYSYEEQFCKLLDVAEGKNLSTWNYSRYWMGFRMFVRPLLCLFPLRGLRQLTGALCFLLFAGLLAAASHRISVRAALACACACGLIEPYALAHSLQFAPVFLLMLLFSLFLSLRDLRMADGACFACFCAFGALTQFFDFYTCPLVTCLFPLLFLVSREDAPAGQLLRRALRLVLGWLCAYGIMWLLDLLLVTVFTPMNGFEPAMRSLLNWVGLAPGGRNSALSYNPRDALWAVYWRATTRILGDYLHLPGLAALCLISAALLIMARRRSGDWGKTPVYLALGALPLLWFAAAAQPTIRHAYFQYRSIGAVYFALFLALGDACAVLSEGRKARTNKPYHK